MAHIEVDALGSSSQYREEISGTNKTTQNDENKDGFDIPDTDFDAGAQNDTWGKHDINTWRGAHYPNNSSVSPAVAELGTPAGDLMDVAPSEHSIVVNRVTLENSQKGADALKKFHSLTELRSMVNNDENGELSREELRNRVANGKSPYQESVETALDTFADFSGGTDGISKHDINREMTSAITTAIEAAGRSGQFGFAERDAIAKWAEYPTNTEEKLNDALEGTGMKAKFETSTFKNYLGDEIPISTVTLTRDNKEIEKFAYAGGLDSYYSLLGGKQGSGGYDILDNVDPAKTYSPEMTQQLKDVRDLNELLGSPDMEDGEITFKEAANGEKHDARRDHAREYLQNHFASLAVRDENDSTISKSDLQNAYIEALATLTKDSILRDGLQGSDLVNGMLQEAIGENALGNSQKLEDTLNAALEKYGYRTSLTDEPMGQRPGRPLRPGAPFTRTLSIYDLKDPSKHKDLGLNIFDY